MNIQLGKGVHVDLDKLIESRLLIQANSGGGKSYTIRRFIEQSFGKKQIIVLDPEGEFGNLRTKYDFIYAGKGGDAPVESRSAALLAHRLLELKASAIIDLYELPPQERKHFVRLFCEALVNAPKELWHDVFIIIDEAHVFAPEKDQSESLSAVIDLASRGRKRGYCAVLATQRPAKLNKDAAAECNNKFIGRASLDIDRKRAAEELGFSTKESVLSLRDLEPGEFYVFGPAISREVVKVTIGEVSVKPPKRGVSRGTVPAPSATVKKLLGKLADLPQEAAQEARTSTELKTALASARSEITRLKVSNSPAELPKEVQEAWYRKGEQAANALWQKEVERVKTSANKEVARLQGIIEKIARLVGEPVEIVGIEIPRPPVTFPSLVKLETPRPYKPSNELTEKFKEIAQDFENAEIGKGEQTVLIALAAYPDGMTREHITIQTGYKRSTRDAYIQRLRQKGFVDLRGGKVVATDQGIAVLGNDYEPLPTGRELIDHVLRTLPQGESEILRLLITEGRPLTRDEITERTEYKRSTRDAYIQRLSVRQLVDTGPDGVQPSQFLTQGI